VRIGRIILGVKTVALFLLICSPALADIAACRDEVIKEAHAQALKDCSPLAKDGNPEAQYYLGLMYYNGQGVPQDYKEAVRWYRLAAEQGNAPAQNDLGARYTYGQGVPRDYKEAVRWYRLAADQGYAFAQNNLGSMYASGHGVHRDYILAHMWYNLAGAGGSQSAKNRDSVAAKMKPAQIAEAQRLAREWKPTKAK